MRKEHQNKDEHDDLHGDFTTPEELEDIDMGAVMDLLVCMGILLVPCLIIWGLLKVVCA